jgi:hypothetical protein
LPADHDCSCRRDALVDCGSRADDRDEADVDLLADGDEWA